MKNEKKHPIPIVYYHSIAPKKNPLWPKKYLTLELTFFEDQLKLLKKQNYNFISLRDYYLYKKGNIDLPKESICITFDDGFLDNWIYAFPILKKYGIKATIFVSPEFVDPRNIVRKNLDDYWKGNATLEEIHKWGYLSWEEMRVMEKSGLIDIQSHALTHTKYVISDKLTGFHQPGKDSLDIIGNLYPKRKPRYIEDQEFDTLIPYGYPIFEKTSALVAKKVEINPEFIQEIQEHLSNIDWNTTQNTNDLKEQVKPLLEKYRNLGTSIIKRETEGEYAQRVEQELIESKQRIQEELDKEVQFCCWPNGDYNDFAHHTAIKTGYLATAIVLRPGEESSSAPDRFDRIGLYHVKHNRFLSRLKARYKIKSYQRIQPYYGIQRLYNWIKYKT